MTSSHGFATALLASLVTLGLAACGGAVAVPEGGTPADVVVATDAMDASDAPSTALDAPVPVADAVDVPAVLDTAAPDPCAAIAPSPDAATNHTTIQHCLDTAHHALLAAGTFPVSAGLSVVHATLGSAGGAAARATISLAVAGGAYTLVSVGDAAVISNVRIDGHSQLHAGPVTTTMGIGGNGAMVDNVELFNSVPIPTGYHDVGLYYVCEHCTGNVVQNSQIHTHHYNVIFRSTLVPSDVNTLTTSDISLSKCDAVTMAGYGRVTHNTIHDNGWDCENGPPPIPAASIYSLNNTAGALIDSNTTSNSCGLGFDIDGSANFMVTNNTVTAPGYQFGGAHPNCGAPAAVFLLNVHDFTLDHNTVVNSDNPHNREGNSNDPNQVFSANGSHDFSDLPAGGNQTIAFILGRRFSTPGVFVTNNHFTNNTFRSTCSSGCSGLGWFVSRGTGYGAGNAWSAATTNYFTGNTPFGSQSGSKRCGGSWNAGGSTCTSGTSPAPCNADDYQHNPPAGTMYRDDNCPFYAGG